jgi:hypothetical protein
MFSTLQLITFFLFDSSSHEINGSQKIKPPAPVYARMQYAGNVGLASCSVGSYILKDKMSVYLGYGFLPASVNDTRVHTIALKPAWHFVEFKNNRFRWGLYSGICFTYSITNNTYIKYPDHFPNSYYQSNAFHLNPFIGLKVIPARNGRVNAHTVYAELGTVDYKIWYALANKRISGLNIWNLCFGFTIPLSKQ